MNFLEFAVWGAYLTCMGNYLGKAGMGAEIAATTLAWHLPSHCWRLHGRALLSRNDGGNA